MLEMMMVDYNPSNDLDLESFGDWNESGLGSSSLAERHLDEVSRNLFAPGSSPEMRSHEHMPTLYSFDSVEWIDEAPVAPGWGGRSETFTEFETLEFLLPDEEEDANLARSLQDQLDYDLRELALITPTKTSTKKKRPSPLKDAQSQKKRSKTAGMEVAVASPYLAVPELPADETIIVTEVGGADPSPSPRKIPTKRSRLIPESPTFRREKPRRDSSLNGIAAQWSEVEQNSFEEGMVLFGRPNWKQIAEVVGTKSATQVKAFYKYYSQLHGEEYMPTITEERLQELRQQFANVRVPKKPGRKPKNTQQSQSSSPATPVDVPSRPGTPSLMPPQTLNVQLRSSSNLSESGSMMSMSSPSSPMSESSTSDAAADYNPSGRRKKVSGEVIVLTAAEEDEAEIVDIDFESDHASIDADDELAGDDEDSDDQSSSSDSVFTLAVAVAAGAIPSPFARSHTPPSAFSAHHSRAHSPLHMPVHTPIVAPTPAAVSVAPIAPIPTGPSVTPPSTTMPPPFSAGVSFWSQEWLGEIDIPPSSAVDMDETEILDIEMRANAEFFEGNNVKTPERYIRIRNHILRQWKESKERYVTKTSVRRGLRDCGDVNAIGRVHQFLELYGAINFGLEAPASCRKQGQETPAGAVAEAVARLGSSPTRKSNSAAALKGRIKLCGFEAFDIKLASSPLVAPAYNKSLFVHSNVMMVMDVHAHLARQESIGLLCGVWDGDSNKLEIRVAVPFCDPITRNLPYWESQTRSWASSQGMEVVGFYQTRPNSLLSANMAQFQHYKHAFRIAGSDRPFIGAVVCPNPADSPVHPALAVLSQVHFLAMDEASPRNLYMFRKNLIANLSLPVAQVAQLFHSYRHKDTAVNLMERFPQDVSRSILDKLFISLATMIFVGEKEKNDFWEQLKSLCANGVNARFLARLNTASAPIWFPLKETASSPSRPGSLGVLDN